MGFREPEGCFLIRGGTRARSAESYLPSAHNVNWWSERAKRSNRVRVVKEVERERKSYPLPPIPLRGIPLGCETVNLIAFPGWYRCLSGYGNPGNAIDAALTGFVAGTPRRTSRTANNAGRPASIERTPQSAATIVSLAAVITISRIESITRSGWSR